MRMFTIVTDGRQHHEKAGTRTAEEIQHELALTGKHKSVRVFEWIKTGARCAEPDTDTRRASKGFSNRSRLEHEA